MMRKARLAIRKVDVALDSPGYCFGTGRSLKLVRYPHSLAPTLVALPSMSLIPLTLSLPLSRPLGFAHLCRGFPARSVRSIRAM